MKIRSRIFIETGSMKATSALFWSHKTMICAWKEQQLRKRYSGDKKLCSLTPALTERNSQWSGVKPEIEQKAVNRRCSIWATTRPLPMAKQTYWYRDNIQMVAMSGPKSMIIVAPVSPFALFRYHQTMAIVAYVHTWHILWTLSLRIQFIVWRNTRCICGGASNGGTMLIGC